MSPERKIGIVGPCGAGKSTLITGLRQHGIEARHIAQEHSYAPQMWKRITNPDVLIYLDVSFPVANQRRPLNWDEHDFAEQERRLAHARQHADFYLHTDNLTIQEVLHRVVEFLV